MGIQDYIEFSDDETMIKDYNAALVKKPSEGELHVGLTNKRVILYLWTKETVLVNSVNVTDVLGTDIFFSLRKRTTLGAILFIVGVIGTLIGIAATSFIAYWHLLFN
jgi:hypothetical protein